MNTKIKSAYKSVKNQGCTKVYTVDDQKLLVIGYDCKNLIEIDGELWPKFDSIVGVWAGAMPDDNTEETILRPFYLSMHNAIMSI